MPPLTRSRQRCQPPATTRASATQTSSSSISKRRMPVTKRRSAARAAGSRSQSYRAAPIAAPSRTSSTGSEEYRSQIISTTFPELVRSRIAYSPSPSVASVSTITSSTLDESDSRCSRQHLQWPSQLCAAATAAPLAVERISNRAASSASSAESPEPVVQGRAGVWLMRDGVGLDLNCYKGLLQSALRRASR